MSENGGNPLIQTLPDRGPARIIMSLVATVVAITTTTASYLLGADEPIAGAAILMVGLVLGLAIFWVFRRYVLAEECFSAKLPFTLKEAHAAEACTYLESLRKDVAALVTDANVRANIFRPSAEDQIYGCAYVLKIDPRLTAEMSDKEVSHIKFLPLQGHTGKAFVTGRGSYGTPDVAITKEQISDLLPELAYVMSFPLRAEHGVVAVLNLDFCCINTPCTDADKGALVVKVRAKREPVEKLVQDKSKLIAAALSKGELRSVRLIRGDW
jgi:hypothetical protein